MSNRGGEKQEYVDKRVRACDYLTVAQLFLQSDFLLEHPLTFDDIKPRLLGHWGTCHGINVAYANLKAFYSPKSWKKEEESKTKIDSTLLRAAKNSKSARATEQVLAMQNYMNGNRKADAVKDEVVEDFQFILGPGHGFPALQANLYLDGDLLEVDQKATMDKEGVAYICKNFSWPGGFPSHASPMTPGVVCEGGELGYALGTAYGLALGHPEKTIAVMLGDGELETASALASLNLVKLLGDQHYNGRVIPILHLNGYKISAPTVYARKSERELSELIRGFGYEPLWIKNDAEDAFQSALSEAQEITHPFLILKTEKGATGPTELHGKKIAGNFLAHQIPLQKAKTDPEELEMLSDWLKSYKFNELFDAEKGFLL